MFKISIINGKVLEGEIAAIDPISKFIALKQEEGSFVLINPSQIQQIQGDLNKIKLPDINQLGLSAQQIDKKEEAALKLAQKSIAALNYNVSNEIQTLFDRISFVYPCKWVENSIIVLDEYRIDPPYEVVTVMKNCDGSGIDRVIKILEGERKKLKM